MFKFLKKFFRITSVDAILADFKNKVAELREHGEQSKLNADMHTQTANELLVMATAHDDEAARAHSVANKIEALIAA